MRESGEFAAELTPDVEDRLMVRRRTPRREGVRRDATGDYRDERALFAGGQAGAGQTAGWRPRPPFAGR